MRCSWKERRVFASSRLILSSDTKTSCVFYSRLTSTSSTWEDNESVGASSVPSISNETCACPLDPRSHLTFRQREEGAVWHISFSLLLLLFLRTRRKWKRLRRNKREEGMMEDLLLGHFYKFVNIREKRPTSITTPRFSYFSQYRNRWQAIAAGWRQTKQKGIRRKKNK